MPDSVEGVSDDWNVNDPDAEKVFYDLSSWTIDQQADLAAEEQLHVRRRVLAPRCGGARAADGGGAACRQPELEDAGVRV